MIVPTANYPTSRDYTQLWELAHTAAIVCIVDMEHGKPDTCRDIARTVHSPEWSPELVQVGSRGIGHVWAESLDAFIAQCEHCNLEWLVPSAPPAPEVGEFITQLKRYAKYGTPIRLIPFVVARAATVLQQQQQLLTLAAPAPAVVPVAVTERLPGEGEG